MIKKLNVIFSGILWGGVGLCVLVSLGGGLTLSQIAFYRFLLAFVFVLILILIKNRSLFKINGKNLILVIFVGICNYFTTYFYYKSIKHVGGGVACMFLYTTPIFVLIANIILRKSKFSFISILTCVCCFLSCALCSGAFFGTFNFKGVTFGILSAITNCLVTLLSSKAISNVQGETISFYSFLVGSILSFLFIDKFTYVNTTSIFVIILLGVLCTGLAYTLYFSSLKGVKSDKACILSGLEPVCAIILESVYLQSFPTFSVLVGFAGIFTSILIASFSE